MTNAVKYSPDGGAITVSAKEDSNNSRIVVEVADEGMGIAQENLDQLTTSFHRISRPETERIRGTGLGLSIVKGLAKLMRGDAWVKSELNVGSSFFFSLNTERPNATEEEEALSAV